eukprot:Lankesteria_metandrocarpae@DN3975_c0_g1_i1.p1
MAKGPLVRRRTTLLNYDDDKMEAGDSMVGRQVWTASRKAPAITIGGPELYALCMVTGIADKTLYRVRQIAPPDPDNTHFELPKNRMFIANAGVDARMINDVGAMPYTNPPCVLDCFRTRYNNNQIYSFVDPILVAINPFQDLGNTSQRWIKKYKDADDVDRLPPHVFSIGRRAYSNLHAFEKHQTITVSGESGSGKTEVTKQLMRYFARSTHKDATGGGGTESIFMSAHLAPIPIQEQVLAANPLLEALGNAKTIHNNNSSRFGRYMLVGFAFDDGITSGRIEEYLLERTRVVTQEDNERSFHIFYQLLRGASEEVKQNLQLLRLEEYAWINQKCTEINGVDDVLDFRELEESLDALWIVNEERHTFFSVLSAILRLGCVKVTTMNDSDLTDAGAIDRSGRDDFKVICDLLGVQPDKLNQSITISHTKVGNEEMTKYTNVKDVTVLLMSVAKSLYGGLFNWAVRRVNETINFDSAKTLHIGLLDIFGFEIFEKNSLEQLFINTANEVLQKHFIDVVFEKETKLYELEGLSGVELTWVSNKPLLDVLTAPRKSIFSLLEDACMFGGSSRQFVTSTFRDLVQPQFLTKSTIMPDVNFVINHSVGAITYSSDAFIVKNRDILRASVVAALATSESPLIRSIFAADANGEHTGALSRQQLTSNHFLRSLTELVAAIETTESHFIRCLKPNDDKMSECFVPRRVDQQLKTLSIFEALQLRNLGYSYRRTFDDFLRQFRGGNEVVCDDPSLSLSEKVASIVKHAAIEDSCYRIGKSMVFLNQVGIQRLLNYYRERLEQWRSLARQIEALFLLKSIEEIVMKLMPSFIRVQAHCRRVLAHFGLGEETARRLIRRLSIDGAEPILSVLSGRKVSFNISAADFKNRDGFIMTGTFGGKKMEHTVGEQKCKMPTLVEQPAVEEEQRVLPTVVHAPEDMRELPRDRGVEVLLEDTSELMFISRSSSGLLTDEEVDERTRTICKCSALCGMTKLYRTVVPTEDGARTPTEFHFNLTDNLIFKSQTDCDDSLTAVERSVGGCDVSLMVAQKDYVDSEAGKRNIEDKPGDEDVLDAEGLLKHCSTYANEQDLLDDIDDEELVGGLMCEVAAYLQGFRDGRLFDDKEQLYNDR